MYDTKKINGYRDIVLFEIQYTSVERSSRIPDRSSSPSVAWNIVPAAFEIFPIINFTVKSYPVFFRNWKKKFTLHVICSTLKRKQIRIYVHSVFGEFFFITSHFTCTYNSRLFQMKAWGLWDSIQKTSSGCDKLSTLSHLQVVRNNPSKTLQKPARFPQQFCKKNFFVVCNVSLKIRLSRALVKCSSFV